jgi:conjugal transfer pilus assembly protein TraB
VPPNAYVQAKVLVGVDAATGTSFSQDPKPVLFRITGPATHVGLNGRLQTTDLTGCLINGAAYGELPSEKVYIKLQKITCPAGEGRFSVATVEGYVTSKGKAGVRGPVISREGQFTSRAMLAGILNGLGQGLSKNVQASQAGVTTSITGAGALSAQALTPGQIATGSVGTGVSQAASMLADYYIKRAEQYQPVIEMPTGIQVELVFLTGFQIK